MSDYTSSLRRKADMAELGGLPDTAETLRGAADAVDRLQRDRTALLKVCSIAAKMIMEAVADKAAESKGNE